MEDPDDEDVTSHDYRLAISPGYFTNPLGIEVMARHIQFIEKQLTAHRATRRLSEAWRKTFSVNSTYQTRYSARIKPR